MTDQETRINDSFCFKEFAVKCGIRILMIVGFLIISVLLPLAAIKL